MEPLILLFARFTVVRAIASPISVGIVEERLLSERFSIASFVSSLNDIGMPPEREFCARFRVTRSIGLNFFNGRDPESALPLKSKLNRLLKSVMSTGILPARLFSVRFKPTILLFSSQRTPYQSHSSISSIHPSLLIQKEEPVSSLPANVVLRKRTARPYWTRTRSAVYQLLPSLYCCSTIHCKALCCGISLFDNISFCIGSWDTISPFICSSIPSSTVVGDAVGGSGPSMLTAVKMITVTITITKMIHPPTIQQRLRRSHESGFAVTRIGSSTVCASTRYSFGSFGTALSTSCVACSSRLPA
mmetsp:Transcript_29805/g.44051  ORF Transcript_29805/g.44051 Transcript_29805/m.44051 type:complete len:303 (-) Transcript_29805:269-1177(-)